MKPNPKKTTIEKLKKNLRAKKHFYYFYIYSIVTIITTLLNIKKANKLSLDKHDIRNIIHAKNITQFLNFALKTMKNILKKVPITFKQTRLPQFFCYCYVKCQTKIAIGCLIISPIIYVHSELNQPRSLQPYRYFYLKCQTKSTGDCFIPIATTAIYSESKKVSNLINPTAISL